MKKLILIFSLIIMIAVNNKCSFAFMFWNQACSFSGSSSSYVTVPHSSSLNITGSFTIEAWVCPVNAMSPANQIILEKRNGTFSNGYTLYLSSGRVAIRTNATTRLVGNIVISNNVWTHISGVYNSSSNQYSVYVNGMLDSTVVVSNSSPVANSDSVRIGKGNVNSPFDGLLDEVRIWSKPLTGTNVSRFSRTTLGASTGVYSNLVLSITFQDNESSGTDFVLTDWSGNGNDGKNIGASAVDLSNRPSNTISPNESAEFDGINDYLSGTDNAAISPTNAITLEAWIYARSISSGRVIIHKGQPAGAGINYSIRLNAGMLSAVINGVNLTSVAVIPANVWMHVAFTYNSSDGRYMFYLNARKVSEGNSPLGMIGNGAENLLIGGGGVSGSFFDGFIDEVRISNYPKTENELKRFLYQSIEKSNEPNQALSNVVYNLDGYAYDNVETGPVLNFNSNASFSHPAAIDNTPVSPLDRADSIYFSDGSNLRTSNKRIPATGVSGTIIDSLEINLDTTITDINVFVALNHTAEEELELYLQAPNGQTVNLYENQILTDSCDNVVTIFDDQADSSVTSNSRFVSYSPRVKPKNGLNSIFSGDNTLGVWRLIINDLTGVGTGRLMAWGIQMNYAPIKIPSVGIRVFMEGFYRSVDSCVFDTVRIHLRESLSPYIDVGIYDETPDDNFIFHSNCLGANYTSTYYLEVEHRNSIETWSANPVAFDFLSGTINYDFTIDPDSAYGSNQIEVDTLPRYAIYGGDVDQNDFVELPDIVSIFNDANIFAGGYIVTDCTGDDFADLTDLTIAFNNSSNFVEAMKP